MRKREVRTSVLQIGDMSVNSYFELQATCIIIREDTGRQERCGINRLR